MPAAASVPGADGSGALAHHRAPAPSRAGAEPADGGASRRHTGTADAYSGAHRRPGGRVRRVTEQAPGAWQRFVESLPPRLAELHAEPPADALPTVEGRIITVHELLAVLREQVAPPGGGGQRAVREGRHGAGMLAGAWRHATFGQARAVLALFDAGLAVEAQANARVMALI